MFGFSVFFYKAPFMGAFLFVNFVSACFPLLPVRCGMAVKARPCALVGALALIVWFLSLSLGASALSAVCTAFSLCLLRRRRFALKVRCAVSIVFLDCLSSRVCSLLICSICCICFLFRLVSVLCFFFQVLKFSFVSCLVLFRTLFDSCLCLFLCLLVFGEIP